MSLAQLHTVYALKGTILLLQQYPWAQDCNYFEFFLEAVVRIDGKLAICCFFTQQKPYNPSPTIHQYIV